jgi:hypothetical protein
VVGLGKEAFLLLMAAIVALVVDSRQKGAQLQQNYAEFAGGVNAFAKF